jgi:hypothetical protein
MLKKLFGYRCVSLIISGVVMTGLFSLMSLVEHQIIKDWVAIVVAFVLAAFQFVGLYLNIRFNNVRN